MGIKLSRDNESFGERNRIFRELKHRTKRFSININSKTAGSIEEIVTATALIHNLKLREETNTGRIKPKAGTKTVFGPISGQSITLSEYFTLTR